VEKIAISFQVSTIGVWQKANSFQRSAISDQQKHIFFVLKADG